MYNTVICSVKCIYYYFLHARSLSTMAATEDLTMVFFFLKVCLKSQTLLKETDFLC